jgi:hypothetical protein
MALPPSFWGNHPVHGHQLRAKAANRCSISSACFLHIEKVAYHPEARSPWVTKTAGAKWSFPLTILGNSPLIEVASSLRPSTNMTLQSSMEEWLQVERLMANEAAGLSGDASMSTNRPTVWFSLGVCTIVSVVSVLYSQAFAADISLRPDTHFIVREDPRDRTFASLYEYIDLNATSIVEGKLSVYSSGWFRYEMADNPQIFNNERGDGELLYAYLSYTPLQERKLIFNLGRHFLDEGVATYAQMDGVSARWEILPAVGVSAYGGVPLETDFDGRSGDALFGGRVFGRFNHSAELGVSYLQEENDSSLYREEIGIDVWIMPLKWLELQGKSAYNIRTDGWKEHSYYLNFYPVQKLTFSGFVSHTNYDDAFFPTTLSAFLPRFLGPGEELTKAGLLAEYQFLDWLTGTVDYTHYDYDLAGDADAFSIGARMRGPIEGFVLGASVSRVIGDTERLRYTKIRGFAAKEFDRVKIALDVINIHYDEPFSGVSNSLSISGSLVYRILDSLLASATLYYGRNPSFDYEYATFLRLIYKFGKSV